MSTPGYQQNSREQNEQTFLISNAKRSKDVLWSNRRAAAVRKRLETGYKTFFLKIASRGVSVHAIITIA